MTDDLTDEQKAVYKDYRTAKKNLKKRRDFAHWMNMARGFDQHRREAMRRAHTNQPRGAAYQKEFAQIDQREKLIDRGVDENKKPWEFPTPEDRTFMIKVLENYDLPSYDPRRPSIKTWLDGLLHGERAKLNHPKRVWTAYWAKTEPDEEKIAKQIERDKRMREPTVDLIAVAEEERDDARRDRKRDREAYRGLLGRVLDEVEDLSPNLREAIERELGS